MFRFIAAVTLIPSLFSVVTADSPNVVFILADDLGITDIASYGSHFSGKPIDELYYETPHMDQLVNNGVAFTQYYANQLCAPTRAAMMTGQYAVRHGFTTATPRTKTYYNQGIDPPAGYCPHDVLMHQDRIGQQQAWINGRSNTALDPSLPTLPKVLQSHRSAFIGKWHLGGHGAEGFGPLDHGFNEAPAWHDAGGSAYFNLGARSWVKRWNEKQLPFPNMPQREFMVGDAGAKPHAEYLTDDLTDRAVDFIDRAATEQENGTDPRPFFLYLNHFAVHTPLQAPKKTVAHFENKTQKGTLGHGNATYAAMLKHLDDSVGRIVQSLKDNGQLDDTVIILTSDNGGVEYTSPAATDNFPFKGGKACLHEGGVRVPLVYWQPEKFEGGLWCDCPTNCIDHLPTLASLTGNAVPKNVDGISIVPLLKNPSAKMEARTFFWHYPFNVMVKHPDNGLPLTPHSGIRDGDYKLLWDWHGKLELFDIANDPYESQDLSEAEPEKRDQLFDKLQAWIEQTVEPRYLPIRNPNYQPEKDKRPYSFIDLRLAKENDRPQSQQQVDVVEVDEIWAANRVGFGLQTVGDRQYVAYFDRNRMMTVACRNTDDRNWQKTTLPNKLNWDSHNRVVLGVDQEGYVHVTGNMHVDPLSYFRSERPHDISRMVAQPMVSRDEDRVTYPRFFHDRLGNVLFSYRAGTCGNGNILVNRFEPDSLRWVRHLDTSLFEGVSSDGNRAAYHKFVQDEEGNFHFVWMWRWTPMVATCHQLCYATSPDLIHWENAAGEKVELPFRPDMQEVIVDNAPSLGGLHNSRFQIIITPAGEPLVGYVKYDTSGMTQLYLAKHDGQKWVSEQISDWQFRWEFVEGGDQMTPGGVFQLMGVNEDGVLGIPWSVEEELSGQYFIDTKTLKHTSPTAIKPVYPDAVHERMSDDPKQSVYLQPDIGRPQKDGARYVLKWEARDGSHGKHAPKIIPKGPVNKLVVIRIK